MRKIRDHPARALSVVAAFWIACSSVNAQDSSAQYYPPYVTPSQSSVYNQNSVYLPTPPVAQGQDIVRGASGVSCQSAVASGGPYVDIGMIGSQDVYNRDTAAVYGRIVVPLGKRPDRPDCTKLYELEITRLRMELDLLRMGLPGGLGAGGLDAMASAAPVRDDQAETETEAGAPVMIDPARAGVRTLSRRSDAAPVVSN